ncbi:hypothetical protein ACHAWO_011545 [Cyclotella atomus]|uniref:Letm1 RBD domain-containing protein n=1 Tax=Cyclotella atomus TaxID=382360 RepID=A0ABD3N0F1_9STRA
MIVNKRVLRGCQPSTPLQLYQQLWMSQQCHSLSTNIKPAAPNDDSREEGVFTALISTVRHFNDGLSRLKVDFLISLHIREAEETRLHLDRKIRKEQESREGKSSMIKSDDCPTIVDRRKRWLVKHMPALTSRRSARHLVQTTKDLQTTLPTALGFLIPVFGYTFLVLGVMFPKVLLSRQFHTDEQKRKFALDEYGFRMDLFRPLSSNFWGSFMMRPRVMHSKNKIRSVEMDGTLTFEDVDAAGPILDESSMQYLYDLCHELLPDGASNNANAFSNLPTSHLHSLALACNLPSILPLPSAVSSELMQVCFPRKFIESRLTFLAEDIIVDDATLIGEGYLDNGCATLTFDEVMNSCVARGLPVGRLAKDVSAGVNEEAAGMSRLLTNHLKMMRGVMMVRETFSVDGKQVLTSGVGLGSKRELVRDSALQLLVLHLSAIRYDIK